jgi:hypothetical protein
VAALVVVFWYSGLGAGLLPALSPPVRIPAYQVTPSQTNLPVVTPTPFETTSPVTTSSPTVNIPPSVTPTSTITPQPTPIYAQINSDTGLGANVRSEPGNNTTILISLENGTLVEILSGVQELDGVTWLHIRTPEGIIGWIIQYLVMTATPAPGW